MRRSGQARGWRRRGPLPAMALALMVVAMVAGMLGAWRWIRGDAPAPAFIAAAAMPAPVRPAAGKVAQGGSPLPGERAERRRALDDRLALTDHLYCHYRAQSQYPPGSRPMMEHADQARPNAAVAETHPMRLDGGGTDAGVQLETSQSRVYLAAGEAVAFSLRAVDAEGRVLPLVVTRALARGMTYGSARPAPQVTLAFADDGGTADPFADDGAYAAVLAPAQTGLAGFGGTIRTEVRYTAGSSGKQGAVIFDVIYTPELPAVWSGPVRDALEDGALSYHLPLDVRLPGRYVISGRVDDARGKPFALLSFNEVLGAGPQDVRLAVFGKLLRDQAREANVALPLTLRDVDGYLLKENGDPDRALLPRLEGKVHTSKTYPLAGFSDAEWQSEERSRYLTEFSRDVGLARKALAAFDPAQSLPASECASKTPEMVLAGAPSVK